MSNTWTWHQYRIYRIIFGIYLTIHFLFLLPWGCELFSNEGMLPSGSLSPFYHLFPNILMINDSPIIIFIFLCLATLSSIFLTIGKLDRFAALFCWYTLTCLFDRNPFIANPSLPYVGWLLIAHAMIPKVNNEKHLWNMPEGIYLAAWVAMAVGYTYSGFVKLTSPSWVDGTALTYVLHNPLARTNMVTEFLLSLPESTMKFLTWSTLLLELLCTPIALFARARPWIWLMLLGMHIGLLFILRFHDLSFGMIMLHFFTFNPAWIQPKKEEKLNTLALDS